MNKLLRTLVVAMAACGAACGISSLALAEAVGPDAVKIVDGAVSASVTGNEGDASKGREVFANRKLGNCLACHGNGDMADLPFHGDVGPSLDGVAGRWEEAELRAILIDSKTVFGSETIMPSFYRLKNGARTADSFQEKTILSAEQVEDVLAYLKTLKEE